MATRTPDREEIVRGVCRCGSKIGQPLRHYELLLCSCGKFLWPLRPRRNGPLVLVALAG